MLAATVPLLLTKLAGCHHLTGNTRPPTNSSLLTSCAPTAPSLLPPLQVPAPSSWADGMAPEKVMQALEDLQQNNPNTDAEAMRFAISVSELQPDTGGPAGAARVCKGLPQWQQLSVIRADSIKLLCSTRAPLTSCAGVLHDHCWLGVLGGVCMLLPCCGSFP